MDNCAGAVENRAGLNLKRRRKEEIMSNRLFQGVIHQMRDSIDRTIGVIVSANLVECVKNAEQNGEDAGSLVKEAVNLLVKSR